MFDTAIEAADVRCPYCFQKLSIDLNQPAYQPAAGKQESRKSIINEIDMTKWRSSTKIEALTEELSLLRRRDSTITVNMSTFWILSIGGFEGPGSSVADWMEG